MIAPNEHFVAMVKISVELLRKASTIYPRFTICLLDMPYQQDLVFVVQRAEHNDGVLYTLTEISLHQQNIEKVELLGHLCRNLRVLQLQGNLICKIENLHRLKVTCAQSFDVQLSTFSHSHYDSACAQELRHLSLALNNITRIQNLQRCESLERLDLTANFVPKASLCSVASLVNNIHFRELHLLGNPCTEWSSYRTYVVASLLQLRKLVRIPGACCGFVKSTPCMCVCCKEGKPL